jgi:hypothetical protein
MTKLQPGEVLCMTEAVGMTVTARTGTVWVTEQGENFTLTRPGLAVVEAFNEASVSLDS